MGVAEERRRCRTRRQLSLRRPTSALPSWSARSASSMSNLIFFSKPCGRSGEHAGRAPGRLYSAGGDNLAGRPFFSSVLCFVLASAHVSSHVLGPANGVVMTTRLPPHVSFGQISGDHRSGELHSISCSVQDGTGTTEIMFMDVAAIIMPLQLPVARDKLRRLAEALLNT